MHVSFRKDNSSQFCYTITMLTRVLNLIALLGLAILVWFLNLQYGNVYLDRLFYTFIAIAASYFVFKILLEGVISKRIKESKTRYSFRKTIQLLFVVVSLIIILRVWVEDPQALLVSYGLFAAGVAIALQDVFKNFAGSIVIFFGSTYDIGDRIQIGNTYGDVIDIGLFYTTVIELRGWVNGDQATGRIVLVPNGDVVSLAIHNYTKDHNFIWDEVALPITYDSNWKKAVDLIYHAVKDKTAEDTVRAEKEISHLAKKYYLSKRNIEPTVFTTLTDNWILLNIRYVAIAHERRFTQSELHKLILEIVEENDDIHIASETLSVSNSTS